jgi:hypothetical protein
VEIVIATEAELFPGVIDPDGLKRHCAPAGNPEQARLTGLVNDVPTGAMLKL